MKVSDERILTTHAGSLPRTTALTDLLIRREQGKPFDRAEFDREVDRALDASQSASSLPAASTLATTARCRGSDFPPTWPSA